MNTELQWYEKMIIYGTKVPSNSINSKMRDTIKNEMGEDVIFIIHNGILNLEAGIRLLIGWLCILGVIMFFRLETHD